MKNGTQQTNSQETPPSQNKQTKTSGTIMGNIQNPRKSTNQPEKRALDTIQNKSIEDNTPPESTEQEEIEEAEPTEEQQPTTEQETKEETIEQAPLEEEAKPEEEIPEEIEEKEVEKKPKREKAPKEEEIVEERIYTIPLRRAWISPRKKRTPRAVRLVKSFIQRHMKIQTGAKTGEEEEEERLVISNEVNERLWNRGIEKPPRNIRVRAVKDKEGTVTLYLAEGE